MEQNYKDYLRYDILKLKSSAERNKMNPKVSFITGVKNRSEELKETIQTMIDQDMNEWEAIIVSDHSEEPIEEIVKSFNDERLIYLPQVEGKRGISEARNLAVSHARADIMLTADGDDLNHPNRARVTYELMTQNGYDVFYCNLNDYIPAENKFKPRIFQPFNAELFKMFNFITNPGTACAKEIFEKAGGFDPEFSLSEDYDLWLRMLQAGAKFGFTEEILVDYRRSSGSVSVTKFSQMHEYIMKTRIKNNIPPFDIESVRKFALPEITNQILSEKGYELWKDDRYQK